MARSRKLVVEFIGDTASLERATKKAGKDVHGLTGSFRKASGGAASLAKGFAGVAAAAGGLSVLKTAISSASDVNESLSKNVVLFGKNAKAVEAFAKKSSVAFGISRRSALEYTGTFGNLFTALGVTQKKSAGFSVGLTKLASDMASFNNTSIEDALEAIRSGLVGETEPLRKFGVNLNDATLRQQAMAMGLTDSVKNVLTPYQKAMASQALIVKQTAAAHGDFKRTQGGLANQTKILKAQMSDLQVALGSALIPIVLSGAKAANKFVGEMRSGTGAGGEFVAKVKEIWAAMKPVLVTLGNMAKAVGEFALKHPIVTKLAGSIVAVGLAVKTIKWASAISGLSTFLTTSQALKGPLIRIFTGLGATSGGAYVTSMMAVMSVQGAKFKALGLRMAGWLFAGFLAFEIGRKIGEAIRDPVKNALAGVSQEAGKEIGRQRASILNRHPTYIPPKQTSTPIPGKLVPGKLGKLPLQRAMGGPVRSPVVMMGEEAPRHPEWVIATNPAYRKQNLGYLAKAASALGVKGFAKGGRYSNADLQRLWASKGGSKDAAPTAAAIALAESGGVPSAVGRNTNGTLDRGLWQINSIHGALSTTNVDANARAAIKLSGNGRNWRPWVTYNTGAFRRFMSAAVKVDEAAATGGTQKLSKVVKNARPERFVRDGIVVSKKQAAVIDARRKRAVRRMRGTRGQSGSFLGIPERADGSGGVQAALSQGSDLAGDPLLAPGIRSRLGLGPADPADAAAAPVDNSAEILAGLVREQVENQRKLIALATSQPGMLTAALGAVLSGDIGGRAGLGFATPGFAGGGVRY